MTGWCSTSSSINSPFSAVSLVAHADWSKNPGKRWAAIAIHTSNHQWRLYEPIKVDDPSKYFTYLKSLQAISGSILTGFDFPIGLPIRYARQAGISDFLSALPNLGFRKWQDFFFPARSVEEISLFRPFYPDKPGNSSRLHLENGLGIPFNQLYRLCEMRQLNRPAACPLFWTLGGQQVGKAAISGWRDLLIPALADPQLNLKIWPFSGTLAECFRAGDFVVTETYPAEFYGHLGLSFTARTRRSKRRRSDRQSFAGHLLEWSTQNQLDLEDSLAQAIRAGFGDSPDGEDRFDAVAGLYGMINIVLGGHAAQEPILPFVRSIEGWIFGQSISKGEHGVGYNEQ